MKLSKNGKVAFKSIQFLTYYHKIEVELLSMQYYH